MKKITILCQLCLITPLLFGNTNDESPLRFHAGSGVTVFDNMPVVSFDVSFSCSLASWLDIGIAGGVFHTLERQYADAADDTYQAESATSEIFLHPHWDLNKKWEMGIRIGLGQQLVQFRYEEYLRDSLVWTEEYLDKISIPMQTISVTIEYQLCPKHSIYVGFGYRNLKKTYTTFTDSNEIPGGFFANIQYGFGL